MVVKGGGHACFCVLYLGTRTEILTEFHFCTICLNYLEVVESAMQQISEYTEAFQCCLYTKSVLFQWKQ